MLTQVNIFLFILQNHGVKLTKILLIQIHLFVSARLLFLLLVLENLFLFQFEVVSFLDFSIL